jgi:hypothetical protein
VFVAVKVYVVVADGETVTEPPVGNVSTPSISIGGFTLTLCAFVLLQFSVARSPAVMVVLSALAAIVGACTCGGGGGGSLATPPAQPAAVIATMERNAKKKSLDQRFDAFTSVMSPRVIPTQ